MYEKQAALQIRPLNTFNVHMTLSFLETHLQNGPIEAQKNAPGFIPNTVQTVGERTEEELVAQTTPSGHMRRKSETKRMELSPKTNESSFERANT